MRALVVSPGVPASARVEAVPEPLLEQGDVLLQGLLLGICGTDREIVAGDYGEAPAGDSHLVLGHESLGRVLEAAPGSGLRPGDLAVGIVRRPDPVPCSSCAAGEWDMCRNGRFTEHGIRGRHGFGRERYRLPASHVVRLDRSLERVGVLLEPASVLAKAWEHIARIGGRAAWHPERVLVTGAGPIGLLAAMMGVQRGLDVHVMDLVTDGPKPDRVRELGARYFVGSIEQACAGADIVLECTGVGELVYEVMRCSARGAIVCLTGISSGTRRIEADVTSLSRSLVLENDVVFGSVNANRRHYEAGADALRRADQGWLERLITRRLPLDAWPQALERGPGDIKTVLELS